MHAFEDGLREILASAEPVGTERVPLARAAGRVLAEPIRADRDLPPFDRSERDGWAVRSADLIGGMGALRREETVLFAGYEPRAPLGAGAALRIMTGAPLPPGADAVVPLESSRVARDRVEVAEKDLAPGLHRHARGVDARAGDLLLAAGTELTPNRLALAAAVGAERPSVRRRVRVALLSTGDEVVPAAASPGVAGIRDANGPAAAAALAGLAWVEPASPRIVPDVEAELESALGEAIEGADAVVLSGGVSAGDKDLVPGVLARLGVREVLHRLAIRPGKPVWFGLARSGALVFGLPGNPMSFQVTFHEIALVALRKLAGLARVEPEALRLPLGAPIEKKIAFRQFVPARLENGDGPTRALPVPNHGSGDAVAAARADGVIVLPEGPAAARPGDFVLFHPWVRS